MNKYILSTIFCIFISLSSVNAFAKNSLIGSWASNKITLNLKANHKYTYSVKILRIKKTFKGKWSTKIVTKKNGKKAHYLVMTYRLFGQHKKTSEYSFSKGKLKLIQSGKVHYLKRV